MSHSTARRVVSFRATIGSRYLRLLTLANACLGVRKTTAARSKAPPGVITCHVGLHTSRLSLARTCTTARLAANVTRASRSTHPGGCTKLRRQQTCSGPTLKNGPGIAECDMPPQKKIQHRPGFQRRDPQGNYQRLAITTYLC